MIRTRARWVAPAAASAVLAALLTAPAPAQAAPTFNYAEALQKSIFFYEAQQAGELPDWNRVEWRDDSTLHDGESVGVDLTGGWFDAGDHVKFGFPMAFTTTMLAWGLADSRDGFEAAGQLTAMENNLRWATDYLVRAHPSPNTLYVQVGDGAVDHAYWGPPEALDILGMDRPVYKIDAAHPGTDVAAETAAAMAASAVALRPGDSRHADTLVTHAEQLFTFADSTKGTNGQDTSYVKSVPEAQAYYNAVWEGTNSNPGATKMYWDELAWAAVWLYRATGEESYLERAREFYPQMGDEQPPGGSWDAKVPAYSFGLGWNDKQYGVYVLMARLTGEQRFHEDARRWLDYWTVGFGGKKGTITPGGMAYIFNWGSLRMAAHTAWAALMYADGLGADDPLFSRYHDFAKRQIDYALGDNPGRHSYMVGFGANPPTHVHHRAAHGGYLGYPTNDPNPNLHIIYGALAGGPDQNDAWVDSRDDYQKNEVALDYNAGLTSALAYLAGEYGGTPLADFPPREARSRDEIYASTITYGSDAARLATNVVITNTSAWPPRVLDQGTARYYFTLDASTTIDQVSVDGGGSTGCAVTGPHPHSGTTYYAEVDCTGVPIYPGDAQRYTLQVPVDIIGPSGSVWDKSDDWSAQSDENITVYDGGTLVWGNEPD
jgi:endoglucanase